MESRWLTSLLDKHAPGWRKDVACPVCKREVHPLGIRRHLARMHGLVFGKDGRIVQKPPAER